MKLLTAIGAFSVAVILSSVPTFAQAAKAEPKVEGLKRTPEGKVDFTGTYEWPKYLPLLLRGAVTTEALEDALAGRPLPVRAVLLAFDDSWASLWTVVAPLLRRHGLRAVAYAIPARITDAGTVRPS